MGFVSAQDARVAVGLLNASGYTTSYTVNEMMAAHETSTLADRAKTFIVGQQFADAQLDMILDTSAAANGQFDALTDLKAAASFPVSFAPEGFQAGDPVVLIDGLETVISTSAAVADVVKASLSAISTGAFDHGVSLFDFAAVTGTGTTASVDNGAATTNGGVVHMHVSAFSGLTSDTVSVQHSVDDAVWLDLTGGSAVLTGVSSTRLTIAAGTTVNRYLRLSNAVVGVGSITRQVSFARR